jgi:hypothetical protein
MPVKTEHWKLYFDKILRQCMSLNVLVSVNMKICLLGCDIMCFVEVTSKFRGNILPRFSGLKNKASDKQ